MAKVKIPKPKRISPPHTLSDRAKDETGVTRTDFRAALDRGCLPAAFRRGCQICVAEEQTNSLLSLVSYFTVTFNYPTEVSISYRNRKYKSRTTTTAFKHTVQHDNYFYSTPLALH